MTFYRFLALLSIICFPTNTYGTDTFSTKTDDIYEERNTTIPDYYGSQVLKIKRSPELLQLSYVNGFDVWSGNDSHVDIMVPKEKLDLFKSHLTKQLIPYDVMIRDVASRIQMNLLAVNFKMKIFKQKGHKMTWTNFHRIDIIHEYMDYLASNYPSIVTVGVMGFSGEGRPLKYCKVSPNDKNENAQVMYVDGGIHAREWISPASVTYILKELVENRNKLPGPLKKLEYYILPVMNPDGYEYSFTKDRLWRKNRSGSGPCVGIDLNRNFKFNWGGKGSSPNPCSEIYRGTASESEPETKAVSEFIFNLKGRIAAYVTFHSYGQYILIPFAFDIGELPPDFENLKKVGELASQKILKVSGVKYGVGNSAKSLYPAAGVSDDWAKGELGVEYTYTIELRDTGQNAFLLPPEEIIPTATDALEAFKVIASAISN